MLSVLTKELKNKTILITGGAGSIGTALARKLLNYPVGSIRILDVNEHSLFQAIHSLNDERVRILLGSVTDYERVELACQNVDIVFHTAAIKNIEISEFNPIETIETNIQGTVNLVKVSMKNKPVKFLNISTDKAVDPSTLYGSTKQIGERLISWAAAHSEWIIFSSIRFGNIIETKGNVFELWREQHEKNLPLTITDSSMKRFFFHMDDAVNFILECLLLCKGSEIFVPKMNSYNIKEFANEISKNHKIIGPRKGEKNSEILLSEYEKTIAINKENMWIIPSR